MGNLTGLKCKECGREFDAGAFSVCEFCFGPLEADYNYTRIAKIITKKRIKKGPPNIWRYSEFLPLESNRYVDLSPGFTPLQRAGELASVLGMKNLFIKNDTVNPTFSSKDRMVAVAISRALELGYESVACASTGNLAQSLAAHAARAGIRSFIFIPHDSEPVKLAAAHVYDPVLIAVKGSTTRINTLCNEVMSRERWAFVNVNLRPYYAEGAKTIAFEIAEQLEWQTPDHVVVPVASGSMLVGINKGFRELEQAGLVKPGAVKLHGVQAEGCAPVVNAFRKGSELIQPVTPATLARSLAIGNPADGIYALRAVRDSGGTAVAVSDSEIIDGIRELARTEGIFAEPAGGAAVAAVSRLVRERTIKPSENVVVVVSGLGMKTPETMQGRLKPPRVIEPKLSELESLFAQMRRSEHVPGAPE